MKCIPILLAVRSNEIYAQDDEGEFIYNFKEINYSTEQYKVFMRKTGLFELLSKHLLNNLYDYVTGVETGLDSNGRKNRGGKAFELACEPIIREICAKHNIEVITQKQFKSLKSKNFKISEDISNRKADFILIKGSKCLNIEVNFFSGGGSKPEEIIDSYISRQADLQNNKIQFCLITDGHCWKGTTNQLRKGFRRLNYLLNYKMTKSGALDEIIERAFN